MATNTTTTTPNNLTIDQFVEWAGRPENVNRTFELDRGEVLEVPPPIRGHGFYRWLVIKLLTEFVTRRGSGHLLTNDTGIIVGRNPDTLRGANVMLFLRPPQPADLEKKYVEDIPDLIVEIVSPSDKAKQLNRRVDQYLRRGVPLVWLIDPSQVIVTVCKPNEFNKILDETDELTGNGVLPEFSCRVADLFALTGQPQPPTS